MQFSSLSNWPGTMTRGRRSSPFRAPWNRTIKLLESELAHLSASGVVLSAAFPPSEILQDGSRPYANSTPSHPGVIISFKAVLDGKRVPLSYPCDRFDRWQDNVRAIAMSLEKLRAVDRYGVTKRAEQYRGWAALPGPIITPEAMTVEQASRWIADACGASPMSPMTSADVFSACFRAAARKFHPDIGTGGAEWHQFQSAAEVLKRHHNLA